VRLSSLISRCEPNTQSPRRGALVVPDPPNPRGTESLQTVCWREMDSNFQFRARRAGVLTGLYRRRPSKVFAFPPKRPVSCTRDRGFESVSLQRRVRCEPISPAGGAERQRKTSWSVRFELTEQTRQAVPVLGPSRYPARKATPRTTHHGLRYKRAVRGLHAVGDPEHAEKSFVQELGYLVSARRQNVEMRIEASAVTEWTSGCRDSRRR
jgi:hypothetical protein